MRYVLLVVSALVGCQSGTPTAAPILVESAPAQMTHRQHPAAQTHGTPLPFDQLRQVKLATERYQTFSNAIDDGYVDRNIVIANMGRHLLNQGLFDGTFDPDRPEILVYNQSRTGGLELVAVEYAIPRELSATAPEGFRGEADVWFDDQVFELWTLHAWVWKTNPDGVFSPTNRLVP